MPTNRTDLISLEFIADTNLHDYTNDINYAFLELGNQEPAIRGFMIWVYNTTDQVFTVTPITNINNTQDYPDLNYSAIPQFTVAAGDAEMKAIDFVGNFTQYFGVQGQFSTAPTKGYVKAYLFMY